MTEPARSVHLVGIGGAGMSVIAELLLARGAHVSGSDSQDSAVLARLASLGARVHVGHAADQVGRAQTVVVSSAVRADNPEVVQARAAGLEVIHRSEALARAAAGLDFVAVAGAHGKTTTSGMLATALTIAGEDPSFAVGSPVLAFGTGAHLGTGPAFVAEADESDSSFLAYTPRVAIVTNVEPDHLDHHGSGEAFHQIFVDFVRRIVPGGLLIACSDDPGSARLAAEATAAGVRTVTYGIAAGHGTGSRGNDPADIRIEIEELAPATSRSSLCRAGAGPVPLRTAVPGAHNVRNATAAWAAGVELGVDPAAMAAALERFTGTARRFELRGQAAGVRVIDDYAHHPTEVRALLVAARRAAEGGRVLVLFQPHLYSRTRAFAAEFAAALGQADEVVLADVYAARERDDPRTSSALISDRIPGARHIGDMEEAAHAIASSAHAGDLVLTVGAGDITRMADVVLADLRERA